MVMKCLSEAVGSGEVCVSLHITAACMFVFPLTGIYLVPYGNTESKQLNKMVLLGIDTTQWFPVPLWRESD